MPSWDRVMNEVKATGSTYDLIRRKYLVRLHELTQRNVIVYYSGWMEKAELAPRDFTGFEVSDSDKTGLMAVIHELDRSKGLDLILHTPGGNTAATESIVDYLRQMFGTDTRAIIPHLAMSAGTMIALSCSQILMGKHSSLGPIDPQVAGVAAHGIVEEFGRAATEIQNDESKVHVWAPILAKYTPTLVGECEKAIAWSFEMV